MHRHAIVLAALAGIFFAGNLLFWHHAIEAVRAGLATITSVIAGPTRDDDRAAGAGS